MSHAHDAEVVGTQAGRGASVAALRCNQVTVSLDHQPILHGVDLVVMPGEWVSIIGPNGAGKTTLLRSISGVVKAQGDIEVSGVAVRSMSAADRARSMAWVPQTPTIPAGIRVLDYVLLGRTAHMRAMGRESRHDVELATATLADLDAYGLLHRSVETLSGGERQRVVLARALVQEAPLVLFDEPTTALDVGHQQEVLDLLEHVRRSRSQTLISTMHDLTLAGLYADRLVLIADGRVVAEGAAREVLTEENITTYYRANVRVIYDDDGGVLLVPRRTRKAAL